MRASAATLSPLARVFTWAGALIFLLSLSYFLFAYLTTFGIPISDGNIGGALTWNVGLFTVFAFHHSVFAREPIRDWIKRRLREPLERSLYVWIASLMFIAVCALWRPVPGVAWNAEGMTLWVLRGFQAAGVWLTLKSAVVLDIRDLAGLRAQRAITEFRTSGPYGWVRHPIYSGWFLMVLTASPMTMTRLVFAVVSCLYLLVAIPFEERSMRGSGSYERYMKQVPWRLIPRVY